MTLQIRERGDVTCDCAWSVIVLLDVRALLLEDKGGVTEQEERPPASLSAGAHNYR